MAEICVNVEDLPDDVKQAIRQQALAEERPAAEIAKDYLIAQVRAMGGTLTGVLTPEKDVELLNSLPIAAAARPPGGEDGE